MGMGRPSCLRVQLHRASEKSLDHMLQTRWAAGPAGSCARRSRAASACFRSPSHQSEQFTPARLGSRCTPAYHVEHSPRSRWIVGAVSLTRRTPSCSPHVRLTIYDIWPSLDPGTLYVTRLKRRGVPMPARMYLFVPTYQGLPHIPDASTSLFIDAERSEGTLV